MKSNASIGLQRASGPWIRCKRWTPTGLRPMDPDDDDDDSLCRPSKPRLAALSIVYWEGRQNNINRLIFPGYFFNLNSSNENKACKLSINVLLRTVIKF